jgi:DNA replication protein DnaC
MLTSEPQCSDRCRRCGSTQVKPGKPFDGECWSFIKEGLATIPPIYRKLRPVAPARLVDGKPFTVILGECGHGKSVTAADAVEAIAVKTGKIPLWMNCAEMLLEIRASFDQRSKETEAGLVKRFSAVEILALDDLAAEKISDYSIATLYLILNRRGEYGRPTVITSNLDLEAIAARLDDRIANRLARYGNVITLTKCNVAPAEERQ